MGKLEVIKAGLSTTIQDAGRFGFRALGVPISGAMDRKSFFQANQLVGNAEDAAVLESTLGGDSYRFLEDAHIAITGAEAKAEVDGRAVSLYKLIEISKGSVLTVPFPTKGCRSYVAIRGIFSIPKIMNSYSSYVLGKLGGFNGRALQKGDVLEWSKLEFEAPKKGDLTDFRPYFSSKIHLPIFRGTEWNWMSESEQNHFLRTEFSVQSDSNRMGIRLQGGSLDSPNKSLKSSAVMPGIIQLPPGGSPIILAQDAQTIGGYPRVAVIPKAVLWRLGQLRPGDQISFTMQD
jgi:antagonist of KipI